MLTLSFWIFLAILVSGEIFVLFANANPNRNTDPLGLRPNTLVNSDGTNPFKMYNKVRMSPYHYRGGQQRKRVRRIKKRPVPSEMNRQNDEWKSSQPPPQEQQQQPQPPAGRRKPKKPIFGDFDALDDVRRWNFGQQNSKLQPIRSPKKIERKVPLIQTVPFFQSSSTPSQIERTQVAYNRNDFQQSKSLDSLVNEDPPELPHPRTQDSLTQHNNEEHYTRAVVNTQTVPQPTSTLTESPPSPIMIQSPAKQDLPQQHVDSNKSASKAMEKNPVIYRYFGRRRVRLNDSSIPFLVLTSNVDHWKDTGKILSSKGFNVMICQRVVHHEEDEANFITSILKALGWSQVILVSDDVDSTILSIQAAQRFGLNTNDEYHSVAGLVICTNNLSLEEQERIYDSLDNSQHPHDHSKPLLPIDTYIEESISCPTTIIWNGDADSLQLPSSKSTQDEILLNKRGVIVGGGILPFQRLPEQFAWILSRFVERNVSISNSRRIDYNNDTKERDSQGTPLSTEKKDASTNPFLQSLRNGKLFGIEEFLVPESLLVTGRIVATAILYASFVKVALFQYQGIRSIRSTCAHAWKNQILPFLLFKGNNKNFGWLISCIFTRQKEQTSTIIEEQSTEINLRDTDVDTDETPSQNDISEENEKSTNDEDSDSSSQKDDSQTLPSDKFLRRNFFFHDHVIS